MGVIRPLIKTKIITKKNMTNIACCIVEEPFAMVMPKPEMVRINRVAAK